MNARTFILLLTGFFQTWGRGSGLWNLYRDLMEEYPDRRDYGLTLREWNSEPKATARFVRWYEPDKLFVVAYSYGAGWALTQFAEEYGGRIDVAFCVDPVPRYRFLPMKLISLTDWGSYEVPSNVHLAYNYRQINGPPYGRVLTVEGDRTETRTRMVFGTPDNLIDAKVPAKYHQWMNGGHTRIDEDPRIHEDVKSLIRKEMVA